MKHTLRALAILIAATMLVAPAAGAVEVSKTGVYIVTMAQDPAVAYNGDVGGYKATKPGKGQKLNPRSADVQRYRKFLERTHDRALGAALGVPLKALGGVKIHDYSVALNGFAARLSKVQAEEVARQPGVVAVRPDAMRFKTTDSSPAFLGLTDAAGPWLRGLDGAGVVVGVIDTGIWPEHPSFADDGSYDPPPVTLEDTAANPACEFGNSTHNANDVAFDCSNKLIGARQMLTTYRMFFLDPDEYDSARDDDGHGTHVASTAAGNAGVEASVFGLSRGIVAGIAPRAHVIAYKGLGNIGGFTSDLAAAIDQAVADGVDVINYSIGAGGGLPGAEEIAFLFAADAGVYAATSAGNSGPGLGTVGNPGTMPWLTTVGASTQPRFFQGTAVLGDGSEYSGASITHGVASAPLVDAADAGGEFCLPGTLDETLVTGKIVLCRRGLVARVSKSLAVSLAGGVGMIHYNNDDVGDLFTLNHWVPSVHVDHTPGLAVKSYIADDPNPTASITCCEAGTWDSAPSMTSFSSRGPNTVAGDIIKPDVTAPGHQILAGDSPTRDPGRVQGELFHARSGTSQSSPQVAGIFALLKQAHPDWSPALAKSAVMTSAYQDVRDNDRVSQAGPFAMGAGHVNPGGMANKGSVFEPGLAYDAGLFEYGAFTCGADLGVFGQGTCDFLENLGIPTDPSDLNLASIGIADLPGSQTVVRTVTSVTRESGWRTYRPFVETPPGYDVTVVPSSITLMGAQSATFEVTIANDGSAPIGEWRFGSLSWRDDTGHYDVYSPIAVRGVLFSAPAEISGSGASGAESFDVQFGYSGSYRAAAHGLVAATVTTDNVVQDPDQSFDRGDGFSNEHQFNLSGAAHLRIAVPPEATEADADLDLFLFDPSGTLAATSTSSGTNELIDVADPADGTWSLWVHGWNTPGGDSDYDMFSWVVSATPGGNLSLDAAPASATIGTTGTIGVSWTGATLGQWHLGAVSHTGPSGLLGLTPIEIDNR